MLSLKVLDTYQHLERSKQENVLKKKYRIVSYRIAGKESKYLLINIISVSKHMLIQYASMSSRT